MTQESAGAVQASPESSPPKGSPEQTLADGSGGVITRTAPSSSGSSYAGGVIVENDVGDSQEALIAAIDATIKPFSEGDLVNGTVVKIDKDETLLDIGYKSEGVIPVRELSIRNDVDPAEVVSVGDEIEALVLQKEDAEGRLILSKKRAQYERAWGRIDEIKRTEGTVTGTVIEVVKGGLILDIGLRGFLPASLVEMRRVRELQPYVGKELECRIIELDKNRNNVVLSRRKFLEESQAEQRHDFLTSLTKGEIRRGTISSIVNFGAFVDLGGVDGLVHVSELSWKHVDHPTEIVQVGQEVDVEVLDVDLERERVSLSLKATQEDPWRQFARQHSIGDVIEGRVTKLVPFGAFVEVDDAIEGLVHISELADHHVERAEDVVRVHDRVPVRIIDIDLDRRRISLSRKQALQAEAVGEGPEEVTEVPEIELEPAAEASDATRESAGVSGADEGLESDRDASASEQRATDGDLAVEDARPPDQAEPEVGAPLESAAVSDEPLRDAATEGVGGRVAEDGATAREAGEDADSRRDDGDPSIESIVEDLKRKQARSQ